jgi:F0F1-type ATP synthase assembly protein I
MNDQKKDDKRAWADFSTAGIMFPASIAVGFFIGYMLDKNLHTSPYLTIIMTLYGIAAAFFNLFKISKKYGKKNKE